MKKISIQQLAPLLTSNRKKRIEKVLSKIKKGSKVLDLACGTGLVTKKILKKIGGDGDVFGIDISDEMINLSKDILKGTDWDFSVEDVEQTKFEANKFDCVVASGVIEYMNEDLTMLHEMQRILKFLKFLQF